MQDGETFEGYECLKCGNLTEEIKENKKVEV